MQNFTHNFENFAKVKFRDILLAGTGHRDRRLNRDCPGQSGTYGRPKSSPTRYDFYTTTLLNKLQPLEAHKIKVAKAQH